MKAWLVPLLQSQSWAWVPLVVERLGMSTHRFDWTPTIGELVNVWAAASPAAKARVAPTHASRARGLRGILRS